MIDSSTESHPRRRWRVIAAPAAVILAVGGIAVTGRSQEAPAEHDELHAELQEARDDLSSIQAAADSVEAQIASIDEQAAVVARALDITQRIVARAKARMAALEQQIERKQAVYVRAQDEIERLAESLYKSGPTAELDNLLSADDVTEISSLLEYSGAASEDRANVIIQVLRLRESLKEDRATLAVTLKEAKDAEAEQQKQAQHLRELRSAQSMKLAKLRSEIASERAEAAAIQEQSAAIAQQLATDVAPSATGASGFGWPINGSITSGYGERWGRMHSGIDIDCVTGAAIRASKAGTVTTATYDGGYGNYVVIDHGGGFASLYAHNSSLSVSSGQSVSQGEVISACGSTGQSTGDHLHFEIRVNGSPQDPMRYLP